MNLTQQLSPGVHFATPAISARDITLTRAADDLWRVHARGQRIIGHLRITVEPLGIRYRAERLNLPTGTFRLVGEFWSPEDAVAALRY